MLEFDETVEKEPAWYGDIVQALARDSPEEALRQALEALATFRNDSDRTGEIVAIRALSKANLKKGDLWNAKRNADEGLELAKQSGDQRAEAAALHVLARFHLKERRAGEAKLRALSAIESYRVLNDEVGVAASSNSLALAYLSAEEYDQAHELANQALGTFETLDNRYGQADAIYTRVQICLAEEKLDEAVYLLEDMVKVFEGVEDRAAMGLAELAKAEIHLSQSDLQKTIDEATRASELFEVSGGAKRRARAVLIMAKAFEIAEQTVDMMSCAEAAYGFFDEAHDLRGKANCLEMIANGAKLAQEFSKAVELFEAASFLFRQLKDRWKEAEMLNHLAWAQLQAFDSSKDTPEYGWQQDDILAPVRNSKRACALYVELGATQNPGHAVALQTLAHALLNTTSRQEAMGRTLESRRIFQSLGDKSGEATALGASAVVLLAQGLKNKEVLGMLEEALALAEEGGDAKVVQSVMNQLAKAKKAQAPPSTTNLGYDIFVGFRGERKLEFSDFQSRRMKIPAPHPDRKYGSAVPTISEDHRRVPEKRPVLFETKLVPAVVTPV